MTTFEPWGAGPLPDTMPESEFTQKVIGLCRQTGWRVAHFRPAITRSGKWATHMSGHRGYPDLTIARAGVVILAELKAAKGRLSAEQKEWLEAVTDQRQFPGDRGIPPEWLARRARTGPLARMHHAVVWRPADWPHIVSVLTSKEPTQ